jgi:hypothetical protein
VGLLVNVRRPRSAGLTDATPCRLPRQQYFLGVKIPLRGLITSTHDVDDFVSLSLSSQVNEGFAEAEKTTDASADAAFPPSYYEAVGMDVVDGKEGSGFDEGVRLF